MKWVFFFCKWHHRRSRSAFSTWTLQRTFFLFDRSGRSWWRNIKKECFNFLCFFFLFFTLDWRGNLRWQCALVFCFSFAVGNFIDCRDFFKKKKTLYMHFSFAGTQHKRDPLLPVPLLQGVAPGWLGVSATFFATLVEKSCILRRSRFNSP